jgi:hypothetical protein
LLRLVECEFLNTVVASVFVLLGYRLFEAWSTPYLHVGTDEAPAFKKMPSIHFLNTLALLGFVA